MANQHNDRLGALSKQLPEEAPAPTNAEHEPPILEHDPTVGYRLNHFMLRIRDPEATMNFYIGLMGMRTIFKRNTGPITVHYLGYPQTPVHRADPSAFSEDTSPHSVLSRTLGLLELCYFHGSETQPTPSISTGGDPPHLGFNHLGFTVPDVKATVERLRANGVPIVKDVDEGPNDLIPITKWERDEGVIATTELNAGFGKILGQIAFVRDPNGYLVEIVPQDLRT